MKQRAEALSPEARTNRVRNHWQGIVIATCVRNAQLLRVIPYGTNDLTRLPAALGEFVSRKCAELREEAMREELQLGSRPARLEQRINNELWRALKPFRDVDLAVPPGGAGAQAELL